MESKKQYRCTYNFPLSPHAILYDSLIIIIIIKYYVIIINYLYIIIYIKYITYIKITLAADMTSEHRETSRTVDINNSLHYTW